MNSPHDGVPSSIDRSALTPLVRRTLNSDTAEIDSWTCEPVRRGYGGAHLFHISGTAQSVPWSLFLKVVRATENWGDTASWIREVRAYQSGFLDELPGNLAAPRCFAVKEREEDEFWIWLEEVQDCIGDRWPPQRYGLAARHMGQFNGAYLAGRPLPTHDWLSRKWLRGFIAPYAALIERLQQPPLPPLLRRACPSDCTSALIQFWSERERFLQALERLPQTVCHLDAWGDNLFARDEPNGVAKTVLIDWAFTGIGAIGEELAPLIVMFRVTQNLGSEQSQDISEPVFQGYQEGLIDAGWHGDPRLVQLGFLITASLRYGLMWPNVALGWSQFDEQQRANVERSLNMTLEETADIIAGTIPGTLRVVDRARRLIDAIF
jgi:hypothetical protein